MGPFLVAELNLASVFLLIINLHSPTGQKKGAVRLQTLKIAWKGGYCKLKSN